MKIEELLEQHSSYNLGFGFTISKRKDREWCIYYKGKHVDAWELGAYCMADRDLSR